MTASVGAAGDGSLATYCSKYTVVVQALTSSVNAVTVVRKLLSPKYKFSSSSASV
jgi:hypothetical protein